MASAWSEANFTVVSNRQVIRCCYGAADRCLGGGAGYWCGPAGLKLDQYVLSLSGKDKPKVCAIPTASRLPGSCRELLRHLRPPL